MDQIPESSEVYWILGVLVPILLGQTIYLIVSQAKNTEAIRWIASIQADNRERFNSQDRTLERHAASLTEHNGSIERLKALVEKNPP